MEDHKGYGSGYIDAFITYSRFLDDLLLRNSFSYITLELVLKEL